MIGSGMMTSSLDVLIKALIGVGSLHVVHSLQMTATASDWLMLVLHPAVPPMATWGWIMK